MVPTSPLGTRRPTEGRCYGPRRPRNRCLEAAQQQPGVGVIGHIVLGIVGAMVGGFLASALFGVDAINGALDPTSIMTATIGAVITVVVLNAIGGRSRRGRGLV